MRPPFFIATTVLLTLGGCAVEQQRLVSVPKTPFLQPYGPEQHRVYLQALNTSQFKELDLTGALRREPGERGYTIVAETETADFIPQVNIRFADCETARMSGIGTIGGGVAGGAVAGTLAEYLAGDQTYTMWVDSRLTQVVKDEKLPTREGTVSAHAEGACFHSMSDIFTDLRDRTASAIAGFFHQAGSFGERRTYP